MKATWNGEILAESNDTVTIEGNHYFPPDSINEKLFKPSSTTTQCPWKGTAHYYTVVVGEEENQDAAWFYPDPKDAAAPIKDRVAFWRGVEVSEG